MKFRVSLCAGLLATVALLPQARGELVLENDSVQDDLDNGAQAAPAAPAASEGGYRRDFRPEAREDMRGALGSSERVRTTNASSNPGNGGGQRQSQEIVMPRDLPQGGNTSIIQVQPQVQAQAQAQSSAEAEAANANRSELLRRQRVREEIRNEDLLQERLESLRLRDEQRRTDDLLGTNGAAASATSTAIANGPRDVVVVGAVASTASPVAGGDTVVVSQSVATSTYEDEEKPEHSRFGIMPRAGMSQTAGNDGYDIKPHYALGVGIEIGTSSPVSFEVGYTYSEYGVSLSETNPYSRYVRETSSRRGTTANFESVALRQNVVDGGVKLHLLDADSKFRPFIGGGGAYGKSFVNYSDKILQAMDPQSRDRYGRDFEISSFLGYLSTGFDVEVAKHLSIGALFRYYAVLSSRSSEQGFNNQALVGPGQGQGLQGGAGYPPGGGGHPAYADNTDQDKANAAGSFSESAFYSILAGVSFTF